MRANSAEIIKSMRKEMGLSQEEMAAQLFISTRQLARIEAGEAGMDIWQFITTSELLGAPSEDFWLLYLDSSEYASYRDYRRLKRQIASNDWTEANDTIAALEKSELMKQQVVNQYVSYMKVSLQMEMPPGEKLEQYKTALHMSKSCFDENKVCEYRMTYNEINIVLSIAKCLSHMGEHDRATSLVHSLIEGRENCKVSEEDKAYIFPAMYYYLIGILHHAENYRDALKACENAVEVCRDYNNLNRIPEMLYAMAECLHKLGEEEHIFKTHLVRAYHVAYGMGKNDTAACIKEASLKNFGVTVP